MRVPDDDTLLFFFFFLEALGLYQALEDRLCSSFPQVFSGQLRAAVLFVIFSYGSLSLRHAVICGIFNMADSSGKSVFRFDESLQQLFISVYQSEDIFGIVITFCRESFTCLP